MYVEVILEERDSLNGVEGYNKFMDCRASRSDKVSVSGGDHGLPSAGGHVQFYQISGCDSEAASDVIPMERAKTLIQAAITVA